MTWTRAATVTDLPPGAARRLSVAGGAVALFNVEGTFHALDDRCPHEGGCLSRGTVEDGAVRCPVHGACFALPTGRALEPPAGEAMGPPVGGGVRVYPVTVINDEIHVDL